MSATVELETQVISKSDVWVHNQTGLKAVWLEHQIGQVPEAPEQSLEGVVRFLNFSSDQAPLRINSLRRVCLARGQGWFATRVHGFTEAEQYKLLTNFAIWGKSEKEIDELLELTNSRYPFLPIAGGAGPMDWKERALDWAIKGAGASVRGLEWVSNKASHLKDNLPSSPSRKTVLIGGMSLIAAAGLVAGAWFVRDHLPSRVSQPALPEASRVVPQETPQAPTAEQAIPLLLSYKVKNVEFSQVFPNVNLTSTTFLEIDAYYLNNSDVRSGSFSSTKGACEGYDILYSGITSDVKFNPKDAVIVKNYQDVQRSAPLLHQNRVNACRYATHLANEPADFNSNYPDLIRHFDPANVAPCGHEPGSANCNLNIIRVPSFNQLFALMDEKTLRGEIFRVELPR